MDQGELAKVRMYYEKYKIYSDSADAQTKTSELQKVHSIYASDKEKSRIFQLERQKVIRDFLLLLLLTGILAMSTYIYSYRRKNLERFKRFRLLQKEIQLRSETTKKIEQNHHERVQKIIKSSDIYHAITEKAESNSALNESDWAQVEAVVDENYPNFKERLFDLYKFSSHEYHLCLLIKIELGLSQIGVLTAHSKSSVTNSRTRLYRKCFGQDGNAKQWDDFIRSL